jgi:hypothetical protein
MLTVDGPLKLLPDDRKRHRRQRNDVSAPALHARGGNFETGASAVVDVRKLCDGPPGDFARPQTGQKHKAERRRDRSVIADRPP